MNNPQPPRAHEIVNALFEATATNLFHLDKLVRRNLAVLETKAFKVKFELALFLVTSDCLGALRVRHWRCAGLVHVDMLVP